MTRKIPENILFTVALLAIGVGLWWERPSLALILLGLFVVVGMIASRRGA